MNALFSFYYGPGIHLEEDYDKDGRGSFALLSETPISVDDAHQKLAELGWQTASQEVEDGVIEYEVRSLQDSTVPDSRRRARAGAVYVANIDYRIKVTVVGYAQVAVGEKKLVLFVVNHEDGREVTHEETQRFPADLWHFQWTLVSPVLLVAEPDLDVN